MHRIQALSDVHIPLAQKQKQKVHMNTHKIIVTRPKITYCGESRTNLG